MDAARQVVRWSIPGALFLLFVTSAQFVIEFAWEVPRRQVFENVGAPTAFLIAAASIPIGFVLWIVYYVTYQPVRFRILRTLTLLQPIVADDRGGRVLSSLSSLPTEFAELAARFGVRHWGLTVEKIDRDDGSEISALDRTDYAYYEVQRDQDGNSDNTLLFTVGELGGTWGRLLRPFHLLQLRPAGDGAPHRFAWVSATAQTTGANLSQRFHEHRTQRREARIRRNRALAAYSRFSRKNWSLVHALVCDLNDSDPNGRIKTEYETHLDLYHALGVVRVSCAAAWLTFVGYNLGTHWTDSTNSLGRTSAAFLATFIALAIVWLLAHLNRRDTLVGVEHFLQMSLFHATHGHIDIDLRGFERGPVADALNGDPRASGRRIGDRRVGVAERRQQVRRLGER